MALPGVVVRIAGEAKSAITAIDKVGDELKKLPGDAAKAAQGVGRSASDLASHVRKSGDQTESEGGRIKRAYDEVGDSALGAASSVGEAFGSGGNATSAVGSFGEVVESFAGMFGPWGVAAAVAGGVVIGAITGASQKSKEKLAELKQAAGTVFDALIEGQGRLDKAFREQALREFIKDNDDLVQTLSDVAGPRGLANLRDALGGSKKAAAALQQQLADNRRELVRERDAIRDSALKHGGMTNARRDEIRALNTQIEQIDQLSDKVDDNSGAVKKATRNYDLLTDAQKASNKASPDTVSATNKRTAAANSEAAAIGSAAAALNNTTDAAKRARDAMNDLWKGAPKGAIAWDPIHNVWLGAGGKVLGRQSGGPVVAGQAYMVGESGPEIIVPQQSGTVIPNQALPGSGPITVHMHLHAAVATPTVVRDAAPIITKAVADAVVRSGSRVPARVYTNMGL